MGQLLGWTADYLRARGSESPRLDAEVLLAHALRWSRVQLYTHFDDIVKDEQRLLFRELVKQRAAGAPVAYLVGRKEFYSLTFEVSPAVLIPRPDTETVVVEFLTQCGNLAAPHALDIGTGSGAIAIACAHQHPGATFLATDISADAIAVARANAMRLGVEDRIEFRVGDLYGAVDSNMSFDVIVSNPPYIATGDVIGLEPGVRDFEPHLALDGGPDGLDFARRLIRGAASRLKPGGLLLLEIGSDQEQPVLELIEAEAELADPESIRDAARHPRVVRARRRC